MPQLGPELTIVVPTFKEKENVSRLLAKLDACLSDLRWEVMFVDDDSPDGTAEEIRRLARSDGRVRCVQRIGRRGLSSACIEGMLASAAPYIAVMDADLQHDERILPDMLRSLASGDVDVVIGSRYVAGGGIGDWQSSRVGISRFATRLSRVIIPADVTDPMSGFFMMRREVLEASVRRLSAIGFKILLDVLASVPRKLRIKEIAYEFGVRTAGESKLDSQVAWEYGMLLLDKLVGRYVPVRFVAFCMIGALGLVVHLLTLGTLYEGLQFGFGDSQAIATFLAMIFNYSLNNALTYRDMRLRGWRWLRGCFSFILACGIGAIANVGIAVYMFERTPDWLIAGIAGIAVGAVWNYVVTMMYTWGRPRSA